MRATVVSLLFVSLSFSTIAQDALPDDIAALYSKYGGFEFAVMMMDRDEWETYRNWEGYDQQDVIDVIKRHQNTPEYIARKEQRKQHRIARSGSCDCWVEPDESYTEITPEMQQFTGGAGIDVDYAHGPLSLPFTFNLFGQEFDEFYINSKGLISFTEPVIDWTPEELPDANYNIISGYWGDADYRLTGDIYYRITPTAVRELGDRLLQQPRRPDGQLSGGFNEDGSVRSAVATCPTVLQTWNGHTVTSVEKGLRT